MIALELIAVSVANMAADIWPGILCAISCNFSHVLDGKLNQAALFHFTAMDVCGVAF